MLQRDVEVMNANGIHARPAAEIVKCAGRYRAHITLARDGMEVNGKSIMGVMMLAAECGATLTLRASGPACRPKSRRRSRTRAAKWSSAGCGKSVAWPCLKAADDLR